MSASHCGQVCVNGIDMGHILSRSRSSPPGTSVTPNARLIGRLAVKTAAPGLITARALESPADDLAGPAGYLRIPNCSARFSTAVQSSSLKKVSM